MTTTEASTQTWLESYLHDFLKVDDWWLERGDHCFSYWQARLRQSTAVESLADGRLKWRVTTCIVTDVARATVAERLCLALNTYAAGWSFAYDASEQTINALIAMCAPPEWDRYFVRLSETAKLSAWFSDVIAERLAEAVKGAPALTFPAGQKNIRKQFDPSYYYLEILRSRPEWVMNLTRLKFPAEDELASELAALMGLAADTASVDGSLIRIAASPESEVHAGFTKHPIVGDAWHTSAHVPALEAVSAAATATSLTWTMFAGDTTNLMGAWTYRDGELSFEQWTTSSELRFIEQLPTYKRHGVHEIWGYTSTLIDALNAATNADLSILPPACQVDVDEAAALATHVIDAISDVAWSGLTHPPAGEPDDPNRLLLWLERKNIVITAAWFNPAGPTISTLEVCSLRGDDYLVSFMRHPFAPDYRVVGPIGPETDTATILAEGLKILLVGSLPNVLAYGAISETLTSELSVAVEERVLAISDESEVRLADDAAKIADTMGRPWDFVAIHPPESPQIAQPIIDGTPTDQFTAWFSQASDPQNVAANFVCLPDAWDGSINMLTSTPNHGVFGTGQRTVTYSAIGASLQGKSSGNGKSHPARDWSNLYSAATGYTGKVDSSF